MLRATKAYRGVAVESASPKRLLDEMFVRIEKECALAAAHIDSGDIAGRGNAVNKAVELLDVLAAGIDHDAIPELAPNLVALYGFARARLVHAHVNTEAHALFEALSIVESIHGAFSEAAKC
jgi:flagellar protein FliS